MKRLVSLLLIFILLLCGCENSRPGPTPHPGLTADQVARAILAQYGEVAAEPVSGEYAALWAASLYGLAPESWTECAIYRASDPSLAFEIAVLRLSAGTEAEGVQRSLEAYLHDRQGDFTGYDPEQAAIVENSVATAAGGGRFAALLICGNPEKAQEAFLAALQQAPVTPTDTGADHPPSPTDTSAAAFPPHTDPMAVYDTTAIIDAFRSGDHSQLSDYDRTILARCREILAQILRDDMSELETEQAIYRWIILHVEYDYDHYDKLEGASPDSSTPYNPLVEGKGICMGYASTFQLLAELAGLESMIVPGTAFDRTDDHAWNMVRLNGEWYFVDATWDVGGGSSPSFWQYFNVTGDYMKATDHQWDYDAFPEATATDKGGLH